MVPLEGWIDDVAQCGATDSRQSSLEWLPICPSVLSPVDAEIRSCEDLFRFLWRTNNVLDWAGSRRPPAAFPPTRPVIVRVYNRTVGKGRPTLTGSFSRREDAADDVGDAANSSDRRRSKFGPRCTAPLKHSQDAGLVVPNKKGLSVQIISADGQEHAW